MGEQIDILLATYNGEKYLEEQLDSILSQTYSNIQLIISDDCSTDNTRQILKKYEEQDKRIKIYYQEKNLGCVKNFEFLLKHVQNENFMLSDQDDKWLPEKVEKAYETMQKEKADLVFGDLEVVNENLETIYPSFNSYMSLNKKIEKYINSYKLNYLYNCITGCTVMTKKKWIQKVLPLPADSKHLVHDHWIGLMVALEGKLAYMPETYIKYRQHGNNQIGTEKKSYKLNNLEEIRELFINVKLGVFGSYVKNNAKFPKPLQELNQMAYDYFKMLESKKKINFKCWNIFHQLYKTENFMYYIENFIILNMPLLGKVLFKIRYTILKKIRKR